MPWSRRALRTIHDHSGIVIPVENILFGSKMVGAVRGIDPETGLYFDDT